MKNKFSKKKKKNKFSRLRTERNLFQMLSVLLEKLHLDEDLTLLSLFSHLFVSNSLCPYGLQHTRLPYLSLSPRVCSNSYPLSWNITH